MSSSPKAYGDLFFFFALPTDLRGVIWELGVATASPDVDTNTFWNAAIYF